MTFSSWKATGLSLPLSSPQEVSTQQKTSWPSQFSLGSAFCHSALSYSKTGGGMAICELPVSIIAGQLKSFCIIPLPQLIPLASAAHVFNTFLKLAKQRIPACPPTTWSGSIPPKIAQEPWFSDWSDPLILKLTKALSMTFDSLSCHKKWNCWFSGSRLGERPSIPSVPLSRPYSSQSASMLNLTHLLSLLVTAF